MTKPLVADVVIVGGGLAGIATALESLDGGLSVLLLERAPEERFGGLAKRSFGGMFFVDTPEQRRSRIHDSADLALADWKAYAEFGQDDLWPQRWAEAYVHRCTQDVRAWLVERGLRFFPAVHWAERGLFTPGNSVPRFHLAWGTGQGLVRALVQALEGHEQRAKLCLKFGHKVEELTRSGGRYCGCSGSDAAGAPFEAKGGALVLASGGIAGNLDLVRAHWWPAWGSAPAEMLNGSHPEADGAMIEAARLGGARVTHLEKMWHYAAGVRHWKPSFEGHGLSLVPPKSALWVDWAGRRIGPCPLVGNFDTRYLVERVVQQEKPYSWQLLNMRIARREFAVSGAEFNADIRERRFLKFLMKVFFGDGALIQEFLDNCPDVLSAGSLPELAEAMNAHTESRDIDPARLAAEVEAYDRQVRLGNKHNDDQRRRIAHARLYRGDRLRTCKAAPINDPKGLPLIAIHERVVTRKSLGGLQTDLEARVLGDDGQPLAGLYAVGEAAGFGGGGVHGLRSLEGTFLGGCIFTGRCAGRALVTGKSTAKA